MHNSECTSIHVSVQLVDLHGQQVSSNLLIHHAFFMHAIESWFSAYMGKLHFKAFINSGAIMHVILHRIVLHNAQS